MAFYPTRSPANNLAPLLSMFLSQRQQSKDNTRQTQQDERQAQIDADVRAQRQLENERNARLDTMSGNLQTEQIGAAKSARTKNDLELSQAQRADSKRTALEGVNAMDQLPRKSTIYSNPEDDTTGMTVDYTKPFQLQPPAIQDKIATIYKTSAASKGVDLSLPEIANFHNSVVGVLAPPKVMAPIGPDGMALHQFAATTPEGTATFTTPESQVPVPIKAPDTGAILGYKLGDKVLEPPKPNANGKTIGDEMLNKLNVTKLAIDQLPKYRAAIDAAGDEGGKLDYWLGSPSAWMGKPSDARLNFGNLQAQTLAPLAKGILGETGVLSEQDMERYKPTLPQYTDTKATREKKLAILTTLIKNQQKNIMDNLAASGHDISGFNLTAPSTPAVTPSTTPGVTHVAAPALPAQDEAQTVTTMDEFSKLPPGSAFVWGPTGQRGTKK